MDASTKGCTAFGHPELVVEYDEARTARADVDRLLASFHDAVASGERFAPGDDVRVGAITLRVVSSGRALSLLEPDLARASDTPPDTIGDLRRGVDTTLAHLRAQQEMAEAIGVSTAFPSLADRARVCAHLRSERGRAFVLDRRAAEHAGDSGLVLGCGIELDEAEHASGALDAHALEVVSVRDLVVLWPVLVPFVALPAGTTVACATRDEALVLHGDREIGVRLMESSPRSMRLPRAPIARCLR